MKQYNIHEAKTHFSALVEKAASGEPFIIAKAGKPLITVSPITKQPPRPRIGFLKGKITIPSDFDSIGREDI
ncbi:MAG: type II toxin-antitoxin system prevent-host-death family antitoxin [Firmicutes bacterium]|nr:type II toxin-antitoxin system prevent-host-death family antitoxin [Bacillota bacterium]